MTKMLGRAGLSKAWFGTTDEHDMQYADEIITAYLAHMATLGWKMMPREMTDEMCQLRKSACEVVHRHAYDHAPEPTEDE